MIAATLGEGGLAKFERDGGLAEAAKAIEKLKGAKWHLSDSVDTFRKVDTMSRMAKDCVRPEPRAGGTAELACRLDGPGASERAADAILEVARRC
jgi:hypothetical protein